MDALCLHGGSVPPQVAGSLIPFCVPPSTSSLIAMFTSMRYQLLVQFLGLCNVDGVCIVKKNDQNASKHALMETSELFSSYKHEV